MLYSDYKRKKKEERMGRGGENKLGPNV